MLICAAGVQFLIWPPLRAAGLAGVVFEIAASVVSAILVIFVLRSAFSRELARSGAILPILGVFSALVIVVCQSLHVLGAAQVYSPEPFEEGKSANLTIDGTTATLTGEVSLGVFSSLENHVLQGLQLSRIDLTSPGGNVYAARGIARLVEQAEATTRAIGPCYSACTLVFLAGSARDLGPEGALGFHAWGDAANPDVGQMPLRDISGETAKDFRYFMSRGVTEQFARKAFSTPHSAMWIPERSALLQNGVLLP